MNLLNFHTNFHVSTNVSPYVLIFAGTPESLSPQNGENIRANIMLNILMLVACRIAIQTMACQPLNRRRFDMIHTVLKKMSKRK